MISVTRLPGKVRDAADLGYVAECGGLIKKSGLVFDDVLVKIFHGEIPGTAPVDGALIHQSGITLRFQEATARSG